MIRRTVRIAIGHHHRPRLLVYAVRDRQLGLVSSATRSNFSSSSDAPIPCDIVRGPSLLRTAIHRPRPSLLFLPGLRSLPFWTQHCQGTTLVAYQDPSVQKAVSLLEEQVDTIRREYNTVASTLKSDYQADTEHRLHQGRWDWHSYMLKGQLQAHFGRQFPQTSGILQKLRDDGLLFEGTPFGYTFFSTLHPQSSIDAHSAPMNLRLRVHLPLQVPSSPSSSSADRPACGIRAGPMTQEWLPGKAMVLDDAYNHQVWNETDEKRVILLVDLWHPDVTPQEKEDVVALFQHAQKQGWWTASDGGSE